MSKTKVIGSILMLLVSTPIWYYLLFKILKAIEATELMWFLFWVYIPIVIIATFLVQIAED